jgi:hypothetical protein
VAGRDVEGRPHAWEEMSMARKKVLENIEQEMKQRQELLVYYHMRQRDLAFLRAKISALPYTGKFGLRTNLVLCPGCGQPFGARKMRLHIPRCKGKKA